MSRLAWIGCVAFAAICARALAQQPLPLELTWDAPAECPDAAAVRAQLERIARVRPGFTLTPLTARAEVAHDGARYGLRLHTEHDGRRGERRLEADDCETLASSVTLVLALAFGAGVEVSDAASAASHGGAGDASAAAPPAAPTAAEAADARAAPSAPAPAGEAPSVDPDPPADTGAGAADGLALGVLIGGGAQLALLPAPALAASAGVELRSGALSLGLLATGWPTVNEAIRAGVQARFDGIGGALAGCGHVPVDALSFALCASAHVAALRGRASGALDGGSKTAPWYAAGISASLTWPRTSALRVRVRSALALSLDRASFEIEGIGEVHRVPLLAPDLALLLVLTP